MWTVGNKDRRRKNEKEKNNNRKLVSLRTRWELKFVKYFISFKRVSAAAQHKNGVRCLRESLRCDGGIYKQKKSLLLRRTFWLSESRRIHEPWDNENPLNLRNSSASSHLYNVFYISHLIMAASSTMLSGLLAWHLSEWEKKEVGRVCWLIF